MIRPQLLLSLLDQARGHTSTSGRSQAFLYELKVMWDNEVYVRIFDRTTSNGLEPGEGYEENRGRTFLFGREALAINGPVLYLEPLDQELCAYITHNVPLNTYTITEVHGVIGTYRSMDVISHAIGVLCAGHVEDNSHARKVGRRMLRQLTDEPKRHLAPFRGIAHLLHMLHEAINIGEDENTHKKIWLGKHPVVYRQLTLMDPRRTDRADEGGVYNLSRRWSGEIPVDTGESPPWREDGANEA